MKICSKCGESKSLEDFYKKSSSKDGLCLSCKSCVQAHNKKYYAEHKEQNSINCRNYRLRNRERLVHYYAAWKEENSNIRRECNAKWAFKNRDKDRRSKAEYKKRNPDKNCALAGKRRAVKSNAAPPWLSDAQMAQMQWFYSAAKMMTETSGVKHHVDHIHPLLGEGFNGLHVPWNLRVIKSSENVSKGRRPPKEEADLFWEAVRPHRRTA